MAQFSRCAVKAAPMVAWKTITFYAKAAVREISIAPNARETGQVFFALSAMVWNCSLEMPGTSAVKFR